MNKLMSLKKAEAKDNSNIFEKLSNWAGQLIRFVLRIENFKPEEGTVKSELKELTFELMKYNNTAARSLKRKESVGSRVYKAFDRIGNQNVVKFIYD